MAVSNARGKHVGKRSMNTRSKFWQENFAKGQAYFLEKWTKTNKRVIGSMIVGNEENRYLEMTIEDLFKRKLVDELVITIDAATDRTEEICRELALKHPITIHSHKQKLFGTAEAKLRERATEYAISKNAYGIIPIDADEIFDEDVNRFAINEWLEKGVAWDFYIAHFWQNQKEVRLDGLFGKQKNVRLYRVDREKPQDYYSTPVHCGSAPIYAYENRRTSDHLFKHYGYASEADVQEKIKRYGTIDPNGIYESENFYAQFKLPAITAPYNKKDFINNWKS
jgi:glycosyltransferase involved in cell wall biosynthesis